MRLVECELPNDRGGRGEYEKMVREFVNSGMNCARVEIDNGRKVSTVAGSLRHYTNRYGIKVCLRGDDIYLVKKKTKFAESLREDVTD